jgi:excisionase family DNA binding protein
MFAGIDMNTECAAQALNLTPQQVRRLIKEGVIPAVRVGKDWVVDDTGLDALSYRKHKQRNRRPKRTAVASSVIPESQARYYWIHDRTAAYEVARIATQVLKTPSQVSIEELTPGEYYWRVANPSVTTPLLWREIATYAYDCLRDQNLRDSQGNVISTYLKLRTARKVRTYKDCTCGNTEGSHEPYCRNGNIVLNAAQPYGAITLPADSLEMVKSDHETCEELEALGTALTRLYAKAD